MLCPYSDLSLWLPHRYQMPPTPSDRGNPKFEVLCQIIAYLHIPADRIFHPDTATDGVKKQKLLLMLQECDEQEAAEILPAIEYLLALIHKRGNSNE